MGTMILKERPRILMCAPEHFGVVYAINPWMKPGDWKQDESGLARQSWREWTSLRQTLAKLGAEIELVPAEIGVPDLVFTANAALVLDRKVLLARFRYPQRRGEEKYYEAAFRVLQARGLVDSIHTLPDGIAHEGAGDCVFDRSRNLFWAGYGPRSDIAACETIERIFGVETIPLELADPRFYHMDTALSALPHGDVMYVPEAFTAQGRATIEDRVSAEQRIEIGMEDASQLAANTVCIGNNLVTPACGPKLRAELEGRGYNVVTVPLGSFLRSGGAAFCLTLRLDRLSAGVARTKVSASSR
jgi:N-dimethylarginine dimethylaminohydrolase